MLYLFLWLVLAGHLLNEGHTFWGNLVLWGGLFLIICVAVTGNREKKARVNGQRTQDTDRDEEEDYILYDCLFEDDDD